MLTLASSVSVSSSRLGPCPQSHKQLLPGQPSGLEVHTRDLGPSWEAGLEEKSVLAWEHPGTTPDVGF